MQRLRVVARSLCVAALLVPAGASAQASGKALWSTYLRAGPGQAYPALDEIEHDEPVVRLACAKGWCRVRRGGREGYVDQTALDLAPPPVVGGADCVAVHLADDTGRHVTRLCAPAPAAPPASARAPSVP